MLFYDIRGLLLVRDLIYRSPYTEVDLWNYYCTSGNISFLVQLKRNFAKIRLLALSYVSFCLYRCKNLRTSERVLMPLDIGIFAKVSRKVPVFIKIGQHNG